MTLKRKENDFPYMDTSFVESNILSSDPDLLTFMVWPLNLTVFPFDIIYSTYLHIFLPFFGAFKQFSTRFHLFPVFFFHWPRARGKPSLSRSDLLWNYPHNFYDTCKMANQVPSHPENELIAFNEFEVEEGHSCHSCCCCNVLFWLVDTP